MASQPRATGNCDCTYSARDDYFSDNHAKELGIVVRVLSRTKLRLELRKLTATLKRAAAVITAAAAESGLLVGPELAMETSSRTLITSLV